MLSGVKFLSRDQVDTARSGELDDSKKKSKSSSKKRKSKTKKRNSKYSSSDDEQIGKINKRSKKNKWYSSDEYSSSCDDESNSDSSGDEKVLERNKGKHRDSFRRDASKRSKKRSRRSKRRHHSGDDSSFGTQSEEEDVRVRRSKGKDKVQIDDEMDMSDASGDPDSDSNIDIVRKEMGLEWMLRPEERANKNVGHTYEQQPEEPPSEEKVNPKELNPYLRNHGSGYPEDVNQTKSNDQLLSSSLVGDGGASWRLKALKRAQEQAEREGRNIEEVVQERWGSVGHLAVKVASHRAAAPRAHLHAIKSRKSGAPEDANSDLKNQTKEKTDKETAREYLKDVSVRHPEMRAPKVHGSLSWGKRKSEIIHNRDAELISKTVSSLNKFSNDGNFMKEFISQHNNNESGFLDVSSSKSEEIQESKSNSVENRSGQEKQSLSANQLAAKAMQLRLKGRHEEAEKLLKEAEIAKANQGKGERLMKLKNDVSASRYVTQDLRMQQKGKDDDGDMHLAQQIMKNKQYSMSNQADDEYDYGPTAKKSRRKKAEHGNRSDTRENVAKRIITQKEQCVFCFENPKRPKHLVISIANFTYLMLPQYQPVVPGHCCIVTLQHESATRMVDDNVWEEIRNFKKCLIMMFAKQDKEMIFLETVMDLARQRRHCLIECIPLPQEIAKQAPLYFKKAIDEAEDEWSQHNAKKLIDTSQKGLRSSIPKNFPYFHVEFGLNRGFVHVIDDEMQFKSSLGLNVVRGMLQSHDEDMYRRRKYESIDVQKQAVAAFAKDWEAFDWTKQLD